MAPGAVGDPLAAIPFAHGGPVGRGRLRVRPEDFVVEEVLRFAPEGRGEHVYLQVEKVDADTAWVAQRLARAAGMGAARVAWAGLKDRRAVARQWFSVHLPRALPVDWERHAEGRFRVLAETRHRRALRRGGLAGNRFRLVVRELSADPRALAARLGRIAEAGVPNLFGPQRFGQGGSNLEAAAVWFGGGPAPTGRFRRGMVLSAARAHLFNRVAAARIADGSWARLLPGEAVALAGSRSVFAAPQADEALARRCRRGDLHPSGPLWGAGPSLACGACAALEAAVLAPWAAWCRGLEAAGLAHERRALRVLPQGLRWRLEGDALVLRFALPSGAYATALVRELLACPQDACG
ncbi:tRNA pseudouridine(13) synthase TruD [Inmirania thermothiophila]|uniref:tRNA pseudouridine synthase D n=1 Tax=Inmirania thermothiophila TaxID=1750597 RepID=A0A3N1Y133_9GAMM|nr:tRNA pseudouridine(13) synthase TruD [Inmirania thermothiophila]ROR32238.1 tRNA pseudouridine13 synthase [Inmirania thermothiophila]